MPTTESVQTEAPTTDSNLYCQHGRLTDACERCQYDAAKAAGRFTGPFFNGTPAEDATDAPKATRKRGTATVA